MPLGSEWADHLPWIKQWVAMRRKLGATCLNCEWDFHVEPGRKPWAVLREACPEHVGTEQAPQRHAPTIN